MTRPDGRRVDGTAWQVTTEQLGNMFSHTNVGLCISSANLKYDKQIMEQSLEQLINFWERSIMNIVDGYQRKAMELMNNTDEIINIRSTLDLREVVFGNKST